MSAQLKPLQAGEASEGLTLSGILAALSYALDLTEGAAPGHALRTCLLGMRLGEALGLTEAQRGDLYYALLLKDAGCSSNATRLHQIVGGDEIHAKRLTKTTDWTRLEWRQISFLLRRVHAQDRMRTRVQAIGRMVRWSGRNAEMLIRLRCQEGSEVVRSLHLGDGTAEAIYALDEHWDGAGYPDGLQGEQIPVLARIVSLAQTLETFQDQFGPAAALDCIARRSGRWFDPAMVRTAAVLMRRGRLWPGLQRPNLREHVAGLEPRSRSLQADDGTIDSICAAFARVIDAKSHSTYMHSNGVARTAERIGVCLQVPMADLRTLRRAGLLHDIGKLSVPNSILDNPGALSADDWACVRRHPMHTEQILNRIPTFARIAHVAAAHHERLDGSGYHLGRGGAELGLLERIVAVADVYDALISARPYRVEDLNPTQVLALIRQQAPHRLDAECVAALAAVVG